MLSRNAILSEQKDILPFFKQRNDLSLLICNYFPFLTNADCIAHEFEICGDFVADLIVGDSTKKHYVLVEFEDGKPDSVFKTTRGRQTPEWAPRFEKAHSQLVDWIWKLEDMRTTSDFQTKFGGRDAKFQGLIVIGKDMKLDAQEVARLKWRAAKTMIDSNNVEYVAFDELKVAFDEWLAFYHRV